MKIASEIPAQMTCSVYNVHISRYKLKEIVGNEIARLYEWMTGPLSKFLFIVYAFEFMKISHQFSLFHTNERCHWVVFKKKTSRTKVSLRNWSFTKIVFVHTINKSIWKNTENLVLIRINFAKNAKCWHFK